MRGKALHWVLTHLPPGITPACAGKRERQAKIIESNRDHPRVCGEKQKTPPWGVEKGGSPPRVRGKAASDALSARYQQDHPRVCGEKRRLASSCTGFWGSPPRVRGKVRAGCPAGLPDRITPACAGKSSTRAKTALTRRDHPRVCGEKRILKVYDFEFEGSPPRVRGKVLYEPLRAVAIWDHPRVCGEKSGKMSQNQLNQGSPPRVRGKVVLDLQAVKDSGITPACAGKSLLLGDKHRTAQDHPRVCGEKCGITSRTSWEKGSPPRVRGKDVVVKGHSSKEGITPACAGKRRER